MDILGQFAYMLALLAVGVGARRVGVLDDRRTARLTAVAFYVALPALIFTSTYDTQLQRLVSPALLLGFWLVIGSTVIAGSAIHCRRTADDRSAVAIVQSYHSNMGFLGLPIVAATLGGEAAAVASVVLGIGTVTHIPITVSLLSRANGAGVSLRRELRSLVTNPVLLALGVGIAVSVSAASPPALVTTALDRVGAAALPLALLCVGATLDTDFRRSALDETGPVVALKLLWMPALAWLVYSGLGVGPTALAAGVLMVGTPTAVSTYIYTGELGGDATFAAQNVFATTLVSLGTLSVLVWVLG